MFRPLALALFLATPALAAPQAADDFPPGIPALHWADHWARVLANTGAPAFPALTSDPLGHTRLIYDSGYASSVRLAFGPFGLPKIVKFSHSVFTIDGQPDGALVLTVTDDIDDPPGPPLVSRRTLAPAEAAAFRTAFDAARLCRAGPDPMYGKGLDGTEWLFEFAGQGLYCAAERWTPEREPSSPFGALAETVIHLAGRETSSDMARRGKAAHATP